MSYDPYIFVENNVLQNPETEYFFSIMKNRLDSRVKRGAIVKAVAISSKQKVVLESLTRYLVATIDSIFDVQQPESSLETNMARSQKVLEEAYKEMNSIELGAVGNFIQRQVSYDLNHNVCLGNKKLHTENQLKLKDQSVKVCVPLTTPTDYMCMTSLMKLITKFSFRTMIVYNALLSEKRILMAGQLDYSISSIQDFVLAAASLVSPPFFGVQTKVFPHVHLKDMSVLMETPSYIAGVTNPTFLMQKSMHDISL